MIPKDLVDRLRGKRCLVTGGAGFIGSNLVATLLPMGAEITVLDNLVTGKRENLPASSELRFVEADLVDHEGLDDLVAEADYVFHMAAMVGNMKSIEDPEGDARSNVMGSVRLYNTCRRHSVEKVVYSSSSAMFREAGSAPIDEEHAQVPESFYALTKMAGEHYARLAHSLWQVPTVCLRYFNVYGLPMEYNEYTGVISIFFRRLQADEALTIYGDGTQFRDFVYVGDVVQANLRAAALGEPGSVYNVGTGTRTSIRELAETMIRITGHDVPIEHEAFRPGEVLRSVADISRAREELGFAPRFTLRDGLRKMWQGISGSGE